MSNGTKAFVLPHIRDRVPDRGRIKSQRKFRIPDGTKAPVLPHIRDRVVPNGGLGSDHGAGRNLLQQHKEF
jgi:hypothetical protein